MDKMLDVSELKKSYGAVQAVKGISFYVERGKLFAFLGPNGAGKSTTIDILCTLLKPDSGEVNVDGHVLGKEDAVIRSSIGVMFQDSVLDNLLTVRENLVTRGGFYGLRGAALKDAVDRASRAAAVTEFIDRPYGKLSGGQRRRADMARALLHTPALLFLDEPTTGLDPQTRSNIWETIRALQTKQGLTVFMTTHYMEEAAGADYVMIIDDGLLAARGTPHDLRARFSSDRLVLRGNAEALPRALDAAGYTYTRQSDVFVIAVSDTLAARPILDACGELITGFEVQSGTMDDVFITVTGKEMRS